MQVSTDDLLKAKNELETGLGSLEVNTIILHSNYECLVVIISTIVLQSNSSTEQ